MKKISLLAALLLTFSAATAQKLSTYTTTVTFEEYVSIATTGTQLTSVVGDMGHQNIAMPFDFDFGENIISQGSPIIVRSDGHIIMGSVSAGYSSTGYDNGFTYYSNYYNNYCAIVPFLLRDGQMPSSSGCWWQIETDDNGEQTLVIEFSGVQHYNGGANDDFNYQLRLHQNGNVSVHYGRMENNSSDTTFNFLMVAKALDERVLLAGTWNSPTAMSPSNLASGSSSSASITQYVYGIPDSSLVVTYERPEPPCPRPLYLTVSNLTYNEATVTWTGNGAANSYWVEYDTVSFNVHGGAAIRNGFTTSDTTVTLSSLLPNKHYWFYVRSDCGSDSSSWQSIDFYTTCPPIGHSALPWSEDFQAYPNNTTQHTIFTTGCWRRSNSQAYVNYQNTPTSLRRLSLHVNGSNNNTLVVALPPFDSVADLEITFSVYHDNSGTLEVGVLDNAGSFDSFVPLHVVDVPTNTWCERTVRLTGYNGEGNTIAFRLNYGGNNWSQAYLDDIDVHLAQGCPAVQETNVDSVGATTAVISWIDPNNVGSYQVTYYPTATPAMSATVTATGLSTTLTGLTPDLDYVVEVAALCGTTASTAVITTLRTICLPMALPFSESFEALTMPACWEIVPLRFWNSSSTTYQPAICDTMVHSGARSLMLTSRRPSSSARDATWVVLPRTTVAPDRLMLDFSYRVPLWWENVELAVGITTTDSDTTGFYRMFTIRPADGQWHRYNVDFGLYTGSEGRIALLQINHTDRGYWASRPADYGFLDSLQVSEMANCTRPLSVTCNNITATSVTVSWAEPNSVGTYEVSCGSQSQTVSGVTTCTFSGLSPQTTYTVSVRRLCSGTLTDARTTTFSTDCAPESLPWSEGFESWSNDGFDACWARFADYSGQICEASTMFHRSGAKGLFIRSPRNYDTYSDQKTLVVLPWFDAPVGNLSIGFYVKDANGLFELGVVTNASDSSTFILIDTVTPGTGSWWYYERTLTDYTGPQGRLALRYSCQGTSYKYTSVDDITVALAATCSRPDSLVVDSTSLNTISVTVADHNAAGHYRLWWSDGTQTDSADITGYSYTITGLNHSTRYSLEAATICASDSSLTLTCDIMTATPCGIISHADLPYTETFDNGLPYCTSFIDYTNPNIGGDRTTDSRYHGTSGRSFAPTVHNNMEPVFLVLPEVDSLGDLALHFWAQNLRWQDNEITVGVMSNPADTTTFTAVQTVLPTVSNTWEECHVSLGGYSGTGRHVALRLGVRGTTFADARWIDDVTLMQDLACMPPDSATVATVDSGTATIIVHDPRHVGHYRMTVDGGDTTYWTTDTIVLGGLQMATDYTMHVASVCDDGSVTLSASTSFVTACGTYSLPYLEDFETQQLYQMPRCWQVVDSATYSPSVTPLTYSYSGQRALSGSIRAEDSVVTFATPPIAVADTDLTVTFYIIANQGYTDSNYHSHGQMTPFEVSWIDGTGQRVPLFVDSLAPSSHPDYNWTTVELDTRAIPLGTGSLVFSMRRHPLATYGSYAIDSVAIVPIYHEPPVPPCLAVEELTVGELGFGSIAINWTPRGEETAWQVRIFSPIFDTLTESDTTYMEFSGLELDMTYSVSVRPLCDDESTVWSDTVTFLTGSCPPVSAVTAAATSSHTASASWTATTEGPRRVEYGYAGFSQGEGISMTVTEPHIDMEGLESNTEYNLYVATLCDDGYRSVWSIVTTFTTYSESVGDIVTRSSIGISPNPAHNSITIVGMEGPCDVVLRDVSGRVVLVRHGVRDGQAIAVDCLSQGAYYVSITSEKTTYTLKLIKVKD